MVRYSQVCPVIFGEGTSNELGNEAKNLGISKAIVVTDEFIIKGVGYQTCIKSLQEAGVGVVEYTQCQADAPSDVVHEAAKMAQEAQVNGVIGIGGGSSLDTAKGVNMLFNNPGPITQYFGQPPQKPGYPLICVPTTAGTGSEVTVFGVLKNSQTGEKGPAVFSPGSLALLDPLMTATAPPNVTAFTGMDAFTHAAESMTSKTENPKADLLALEAISLITRALPKAFANGNDLAARADMLLASNLAGIAFNDAMVNLGHAIAHSVGVRFHLPHGTGCALAIPVAMQYGAKVKPHKVKLIGQSMGLQLGESDSPEQIGNAVAAACRELMKKVQIPSFKELGVSRDDLLGIVDLVMSDIGFVFIPEPIAKEEVLSILGTAYDSYQ
ncbi:MAG: iron-containing alcohol dehydrogenase [Firmicutes bacterium]|nr:iron-containing alcohol dehydrogenase [Bacillota bacterium]